MDFLIFVVNLMIGHYNEETIMECPSGDAGTRLARHRLPQ